MLRLPFSIIAHGCGARNSLPRPNNENGCHAPRQRSPTNGLALSGTWLALGVASLGAGRQGQVAGLQRPVRKHRAPSKHARQHPVGSIQNGMHLNSVYPRENVRTVPYEFRMVIVSSLHRRCDLGTTSKRHHSRTKTCGPFRIFIVSSLHRRCETHF